MTPLGHAAAALLAARPLKLPAAACIVGGLAPDIDFLFFALPAFNQFHRVVTHNLVFVLAVALLVAALGRGSLRLFLAAALGGVLHLACDAVLDGNASNGIGVALLWPFSETMWSPFNLMGSWSADNPAGWADGAASLRLGLVAVAFELPLWAAAAWYVLRRRTT